MNINGLNSFMPQAPQASGQGKASSGKSAFNEILGQSTEQTATQHPKSLAKNLQNKNPKKFENEETADPQNPQVSQQGQQANESGEKKSRAGQDPAHDQMADAQALPGQPNIPTLGGGLGMVDGPQQPVMMAPGAGKMPAAVGNQEDSVDSLTRRVVWNDFLRKMKDELGVSAEEVLGAFTTLSDQDLMAPPHQVADKVVMAMGLNPADQQVAKQFFTELVSKTKSKSLGEELATSQKQINLTLMSQREMMRKSMQRSIDRMNQNFFMPQGRPDAQKEGMAIPGMIPVSQQEAALLGAQLDPMATSAIPNMQTLTPAQAMEMEQAPLMAPQAQVQAQAQPQKNTVDEMIKNFMMPQQMPVQKLAAGEAAAAPAVQQLATPAGATAAQPAMAPVTGLSSMLGQLGADSEGEEEGDVLSDASYLQQPIGNNSRFAGLAGASAGDFKAELANLQANNQPVAIPELVDRAQLMVHGGGGEMKVTLSPDGLGEVAMRVAVQDGKVSVQMITESDEAKKMIERQLSELKTGLSQNQLQVETIKVDTASNLGKQLEQQYHDAQRQMAHQTLEQFRQDHQGWRRSFFEVPSAKSYKGQAEAPRDIRAPDGNKNKGSRRLDLVA